MKYIVYVLLFTLIRFLRYMYSLWLKDLSVLAS